MLKQLRVHNPPQMEPPRRGATAVTRPDEQAEEKSRWYLNLDLKGIDGDWWLKPASVLTALAVFLALGNALSGRVYSWLDQPVSSIVIVGETVHLDRQQLAQDTAALMDGGLVSGDLTVVKQGIQAHPWVYQVGVTRQWPAALLLDIKEEVPVARWGGNGLLNHEGDIFWPDEAERYQQLPLLNGPAGDTAMMMGEYYDLNQMLRNVDLQLVELKLEARGAWTLILDNGIRLVVGREQVVERMERFLSIYETRLEKDAVAGRIEQIDIRYQNGIAVKWRQVETPEQQGQKAKT